MIVFSRVLARKRRGKATELRFEGNAVRTEFELERRLAQELRIEILAASGRGDEADKRRIEYENTWGGAN